MTRPDLCALNEDALAALANRGLVKRAVKENDAGRAPAIDIDDDGTVRGRFDDGTVVTLTPSVPLSSRSCTCAVAGVCRHTIAVVLAYQRADAVATSGGSAAPLVRWTPGLFTDTDLEVLLGARKLAAAARARRAGYTVRVHRPTEAEPVPTVELASCTVRFLVPGELGYAQTDAAKGTRDEVVALAVWAFREADERAPDEDEIRLDVGGSAGVNVGRSGVEGALELVDRLVLDGVVHTGPAIDGAIAQHCHELESRRLRWPLLALDEIGEQLGAYRSRSARYSPQQFAALIAEVHARHRAAAAAGTSPRSRVLGLEESGDTRVRRIRLTGLGCRVTGIGRERTAAVLLAEAQSGDVLVVRRRWEFAEGDDLPTGHDLGRRRMAAQTSLRALAAANVISESVTRSASRLLRIGSSQVAKTTVSPSSGNWSSLPGSLVVRDFVALARTLEAMPPRLIRPRVEAELVRVLELGDVLSLGYSPGSQRFDAEVAGASGGTARISLVYRSACPGALDALAGALSGNQGRPRFVSGSVRRTQGVVVIDPIAVVTDAGVVVPDLAPGAGAGALETLAFAATEPTPAALESALSVVAEAAHRGLGHLPAAFADRLRASATQLVRVGLRGASTVMDELAAALGPNPGQRATTAWVDAELRLLVTAELL